MTEKTKRSPLLLESANSEIYQKNAFRVLSLLVNASPRDIKRKMDRVRIEAKLSKAETSLGQLRPRILTYDADRLETSETPIIFSSDVPDLDAAREAAQRLNDPERRLIDEFFWFWPRELGNSTNDEALAILLDNNVEKAESIWLSWEQQKSESNVSVHNIAVLNHLIALDIERRITSDADSEILDLRDKSWKAAFERWRRLLDDDGFWKRFLERIIEIDDPRLSRDTADLFRATLPTAILQINTQLAIEAAENGREYDLLRHERMISDSGFKTEAIEEAILNAVKPVRERIRTICKSAKQETESDPVHADKAATFLLKRSSIALDIRAMEVLLGKDHPTPCSLRDEVALQVLSSVTAFSNKTEDWRWAKILLNQCLEIAASSSTKTRIRETIEIADENQKSDFGWCGPGYYDLPEKLLADLERARKLSRVQDWDKAIGILENSYKGWTEPKHRQLIAKPLALCLNMRANLRLSGAFSGIDSYRYAPIPAGKRAALQSAVELAGQDLVRAVALDRDNKTVWRNYCHLRDLTQKMGFPLPRARGSSYRRGSSSAERPPARPPSRSRSSSSSPSCGGIFWFIVIALSVIYGIGLCSSPPASDRPRARTNTPRPTPRPSLTPRPTPRPTSRPTSSFGFDNSPSSQCVHWSTVDLSDAGKWMCVKGELKRWYHQDNLAFVGIFSEEPGTFILIDEYYYWPDLKPGDCIAGEGRIEIMSKTRPYINLHRSLYTTYCN